jgi:hypothetical protein
VSGGDSSGSTRAARPPGGRQARGHSSAAAAPPPPLNRSGLARLGRIGRHPPSPAAVIGNSRPRLPARRASRVMVWRMVEIHGHRRPGRTPGVHQRPAGRPALDPDRRGPARWGERQGHCSVIRPANSDGPARCVGLERVLSGADADPTLTGAGQRPDRQPGLAGAGSAPTRCVRTGVRMDRGPLFEQRLGRLHFWVAAAWGRSATETPAPSASRG